MVGLCELSYEVIQAREGKFLSGEESNKKNPFPAEEKLVIGKSKNCLV